QALAEAQQLGRRALELCPQVEAKPEVRVQNAEVGGETTASAVTSDLWSLTSGSGPPRLDVAQEQLLREDVFDAYLVAGEVEWKLALAAGTPDAQRQGARRRPGPRRPGAGAGRRHTRTRP